MFGSFGQLVYVLLELRCSQNFVNRNLDPANTIKEGKLPVQGEPTFDDINPT